MCEEGNNKEDKVNGTKGEVLGKKEKQKITDERVNY